MLDADISTSDALAQLHAPEVLDPDLDPHALDRRRFLQLVGMGVGAGAVIGGPGSLLDSLLLPGHDPSTWAAGPVGPTDGILVVVGMYGGNDGLNTVVPVNDGRYYDMHGGLAIPGENTLRLDDNSGLNPRLTEVKRLWDAGQCAIVEGVGYDDPDLSHFNSMAYWMSGRPNQISGNGWIGRWLDGYLGGGKDLFAAAEVGYSVPLHVIGAQQRATAVPAGRPGYGSNTSPRYQRQYQAIRDNRTGDQGAWFSYVGQTFVDQLDMAATLAPIIPESGALSDDRLSAQLEVAARLINANLGFRVITTAWGDFDSHAGQPSQHSDRMNEFNAALQTFFSLLDPAWESRVTLMTFSEFGRTPWDNDGQGTDHGTSAPHLVMGGNVRGGFYGQRPTLAGLGRWDRMDHHVDFRSYYASVLDGWMGGGSSDVLGGNFENLGLFRRGPGRLPNGSIAPGPAVVTAPSTFSPLDPRRVADTRDGTGGVPTRKLRAGEAVKVQVAGVAGIPSSGCTAVVANVTAVDMTSNMHFRIFPGSTARPNTASLNGRPGRPVPNLVVMGVGADGAIEVFNSHGETHLVVDVFGYYSETGGTRFQALQPARLFDTRTGDGVRAGKLLDSTPVNVQVAGRAGVPSSGATAVVMNVAVTDADSRGFVRVTPRGAAARETANVNFFAGDTVPNLVICKIGDNGQVTLDGRSNAHVIGDVFGYFGSSGERLRAMPPSRVLDTREGIGADVAPVGPDNEVQLVMAGRNGIPEGATAVVLNVAATNVDERSFISVYPYGEDHPGTANLNLEPGRTIANLVICRLGNEGSLTISNLRANCDVIADAFGYFVE